MNGTANELLKTYQEQLDVPSSIISRASNILEQAFENDLGVSRCHYTLTAGATLLAIQEHDYPRVAEDIAMYTNRTSNDITAKKIAKETRLLKSEFGIQTLPTEPRRFIEYYLDELDAEEDTRTQAYELLRTADDMGLTHNGTSPTSIAAACVDAARRLTGDDIYQREIHDVSHVSEPQIRKHATTLTQ